MNKIQFFSLLFFCFTLMNCNQKTEKTTSIEDSKETSTTSEVSQNEEFEGYYKTDSCDLSLIISKIKEDYHYVLKTNLRTLKGIVTYSKNSSGEKYITLEGIKWDEYEGDIDNENDSASEKELEIPVGIDVLYTKDTLTIQNYGNSMNSYTKISECGLKYIQLIRK